MKMMMMMFIFILGKMKPSAILNEQDYSENLMLLKGIMSINLYLSAAYLNNHLVNHSLLVKHTVEVMRS